MSWPLLDFGSSSGTATATAVHELTVARRAMACDFSVTLPAGRPRAIETACSALEEIERLEAKLTVYREDSDLVRVNRDAADRAVAVDPELFEILALAIRLSAATGGAFDAATGALIKAWGFFRGSQRVPEPAELAAALGASGSRHVRLDPSRRAVRFLRPGLEMNLGAIGKGFAIDRATHALRRSGVHTALVQGGRSSLRALGSFRIAIGTPPLATIWLRDRALGTSGDSNRFFICGGVRYGHVLDPRSGQPAAGLLSATALAPTAAEADALSTAFYVLGLEGTREFCRRNPGIGAVLAGGGRVTLLGDHS